MSWLSEMAGGAPPAPYVEASSSPKVADPSIPDRMVSTKTANRPFLAHKEYREEREALHKAWLEKKKEHDAKVARGEKVKPLEQDPTAVKEVGVLGLLKFIVYLIIFTALAGKFISGSYTWEYRTKWTQLKTYLPTNQRLFSEGLLSQFDGSQEGKPIYLAIDGDVYDVTKGNAYQPGGSYHILTGIDAARAFGTGCFKEHRTHDTREMTEAELRSLAHWKKFYDEHEDYIKVGRVSHPPIDPASPVLKHCNPKKAKQQEEEKARKAEQVKEKLRNQEQHEEL